MTDQPDTSARRFVWNEHDVCLNSEAALQTKLGNRSLTVLVAADDSGWYAALSHKDKDGCGGGALPGRGQYRIAYPDRRGAVVGELRRSFLYGKQLGDTELMAVCQQAADEFGRLSLFDSDAQ